MDKHFKRKMAALVLALLTALPLTGLGPRATLADAADPVLAEPVDADVPEAGEAELPDPSFEIVLSDVAATEDEAPAEATEAPQQTAAPDQTEAPQQTLAPEPTAEPTATPTPSPTPSPTPEPAKLSKTKLTLGVKETYTLTFKDGVKAKSVGAKFSSSNKKVVTVDKATGKLKAKAVGEATITAKLKGGVKRTCKVTVKKAPKKVTLAVKKATLGVGETFALTAKLPKGTSSIITYKSSDTKIAKVSKKGVITAVKKGSAKITATTFNGKKATFKLTVKKEPKSISLGLSKLALWEGDSYKLKPVLSSGSAGTYTIKSSDKKIVTVSGKKLKAKAAGTATVTVTAYNGVKAKLKVTVSRKPVYRALLIGESNFPGTGLPVLPGRKDADRMKKMLTSVKGPAGGDWAVTIRYNRMSKKIKSDIVTAFAGAQEGDVSLFYISSHGDELETMDGFYGEYAGCLYTYPDTSFSDWYDRNTLTLSQLAEWLKDVPGQVIVFIDSCGSGAAIYTPKGRAVMAAPAMDDGQVFNEAVVEAFASQDRGVLAASTESGAFVVRNKFYVMTSTAYLETSWSSSSNYSYFTKWLTDGIATSGDMPADANNNSVTTLNELYKYVRNQAENKVFYYEGDEFQQHVQVYPSGSSFGLFYRK